MHLFETGSVTFLTGLESLPRKPVNIMHTPNHEAPDLPFSTSFALNPCSDESNLQNQTATSLLVFWRQALAMRATLAALEVVEAGRSNASPACYAYEKIATRYLVANTFAFTAPRSYDANSWRPLWNSMKRSPHFAHINSLWRKDFEAVGLSYSGVTTNDTYKSTMPFGKAKQSASDHLPSGVHCNDNPSFDMLRASDAGY